MTNIPFNIPVLFMIFNRPEYTQRVFDAIRQAKPAHLYVVADGPRTDEEWALCEKTRAIIDTVDWPCTVHKNYADTNMGLRERISSGITWFFDNVEMGIILEDDCLPDQSFFSFTQIMLERYKNEPHILMINGSNPLLDFKLPWSYGFSSVYAIWGWATWRRAWQKYDIDITDWPQLKKTNWLKNIYPHKPYRKNTELSFDQVHKKQINTWDIQWHYSCLRAGGLAILPSKNLISNIGLAGTHSSPGHNNNLPVDKIDVDALIHPPRIEVYFPWNNEYFRRNFPIQHNPLIPIKSAIITMLVRIKHIVRHCGLPI